jgi:hypothetical protein
MGKKSSYLRTYVRLKTLEPCPTRTTHCHFYLLDFLQRFTLAAALSSVYQRCTPKLTSGSAIRLHPMTLPKVVADVDSSSVSSSSTAIECFPAWVEQFLVSYSLLAITVRSNEPSHPFAYLGQMSAHESRRVWFKGDSTRRILDLRIHVLSS